MNGVGIDLIEIDRIQESIQTYGASFTERIFNKDEIEYCLKKANPFPHFAARFAAKEAFSKAFGTGIGTRLSWHDVMVSHEFSGRPIIALSPRLADELEGHEILLSISHTHHYAVAVVRIDRKH